MELDALGAAPEVGELAEGGLDGPTEFLADTYTLLLDVEELGLCEELGVDGDLEPGVVEDVEQPNSVEVVQREDLLQQVPEVRR